MAFEMHDPFVFDVGTSYIRAQAAGKEKPSVFPNVFGQLRYQNSLHDKVFVDSWKLSAAEDRRGLLNMEAPVRRSVITNFDAMEQMLRYIFLCEYRLDPELSPVLLTEPAINPKPNRQKTAEMMFETLHVPYLLLSPQPVLALYASGRTSGVSVESGEGSTYVVPIVNGCAIPGAVQRCDVAGSDITDYLMQMLIKEGKPFSRDSYSDRAAVQKLKEKLAYTALDFDAEMKKTDEELKMDYTLEDGSVISIGKERFQCSEIMLHPEILGYASGGIPQLVCNSIQKCPIDLRKDLFGDIFLAGGNTLLPGLADRVQKEVVALANPGIKTKVVSEEERENYVWLGGSIQASLSGFLEEAVSKEEYDESGFEIVQKKCVPLGSFI